MELPKIFGSKQELVTPKKAVGTEPVTITAILQQAREQLPAKDHLYYYLQLEQGIIENHTYTKESLRKVVKDTFNIAWFPPQLKALFELQNAEQLIFSEIILESILRHLSEQNSVALQKIVSEKTKGTMLENITIAKGTVDLSAVEQKLFSDEKQFDNATIQIHELLKSLSNQDKSVLSAAFTEVKDKYLNFPIFLEVIRSFPPGVLDEERRAILSPQAAAVVVEYVAKEVLQGEEVQPYLTRIEQANQLPIEQQAEKFTSLYQDLERFVESTKPEGLTVEKLREQIKQKVNIEKLPPSFQLLFLNSQQQLLTLMEEFLEEFINNSNLSKKINIIDIKQNLSTKIPLLKITEEGNLSKDISDEKQLPAALTEYINFFYQKATKLLSHKKAQQALKDAYLTLTKKYATIASQLFPLLPEEVLSEQERDKIASDCYKTMVEGILQQVIDNTIHSELTKTLLKITQQQQPNMQRLQKQFAELFDMAAEKLKGKIGHDQTERIFETAYNQIKAKYGFYPIFNEILKAIPRGILEIQRFNILSKDELAKVSKALKKTEQIKETFTNVAAHELKTPLVPIIGYSKMYMKKKEVSQQSRKAFKIIYQNALRQEKLVDDLLSISKLEAGEMKFEMKNVDLILIIQKAVSSMLVASQEKKVSLNFLFPKELGNILGDEDRLTQVITNLISNSLKFTEKGSITITAKVINSHIQVSLTDTGMGIKKEDIPRLFQKFVQTQDYTTRKTRGTGLGLAICKEIIIAHHGKIWVESKGVGKGSTFSFTLPITAAKTPSGMTISKKKAQKE
jgi:signal transduction histidine kinase